MSFKKIILNIVGFISLTLGIIGIFLPVLPTTPFVLLAAICFGTSNTKFYDKLTNSKYFGEIISNYRNNTGVALYTKVKAIVFLWIGLIISAIILKQTHMIILLAIIGLAVSTHIALLKQKD